MTSSNQMERTSEFRKLNSIIRILIFQLYILVPGEPQNVNALPINSSSIEVSWDPPIDKDKNGVIRGYQIHVQPKNMVRLLSRDCCCCCEVCCFAVNQSAVEGGIVKFGVVIKHEGGVVAVAIV